MSESERKGGTRKSRGYRALDQVVVRSESSVHVCVRNACMHTYECRGYVLAHTDTDTDPDPDPDPDKPRTHARTRTRLGLPYESFGRTPQGPQSYKHTNGHSPTNNPTARIAIRRVRGSIPVTREAGANFPPHKGKKACEGRSRCAGRSLMTQGWGPSCGHLLSTAPLVYSLPCLQPLITPVCRVRLDRSTEYRQVDE